MISIRLYKRYWFELGLYTFQFPPLGSIELHNRNLCGCIYCIEHIYSGEKEKKFLFEIKGHKFWNLIKFPFFKWFVYVRFSTILNPLFE